MKKTTMNIQKMVALSIRIGETKKVSWFNESLATSLWYQELIQEILDHSNKNLVNIVYSLFPASEYVGSLHNKFAHSDFFCDSLEYWQGFIDEHRAEIIDFCTRYGTQGTIPQRAAVMLDCIFRDLNPSQNETIDIVEFGCSAGLLGSAFMHHKMLFSTMSLAAPFFWLRRLPPSRPDITFTYTGYDLVIPPREIVPFYLWDEDMRSRLTHFITMMDAPENLHRADIHDQIDKMEGRKYIRKTIIITSFVMYQIPDREIIGRRLLDLVESNENLHWIDLSGNNGISWLSDKGLIPKYNHLSLNGQPRYQIIDGSDDCPNWVRI